MNVLALSSEVLPYKHDANAMTHLLLIYRLGIDLRTEYSNFFTVNIPAPVKIV